MVFSINTSITSIIGILSKEAQVKKLFSCEKQLHKAK